jgi:hypothetical protein
MSPWIGVTLIGIVVTADVVLTLTHNQIPRSSRASSWRGSGSFKRWHAPAP